MEPKYQVLPKIMAQFMGLFVPIMGEIAEMMYQTDRTISLTAVSLNSVLILKPTPYLEGIRQVVQTDYK